MINVKADIDNVNKVPNLTTTKSTALVRNSKEISGQIKTKTEKITAKPELMKNTGKFISSPKI